MATADSSDDSRHFDIALIGAGSASEQFLREADGSDRSIVMFEPRLVGGECPFYACIPSKAFLHSARNGRTWDSAVEHRQEMTNHLDDGEHRDNARELGATIVSAEARIVGPGELEADGERYTADAILIGVGGAEVIPDMDGLDSLGDRMWTSDDALTATERPERLLIIGGGVIGSEIAQMYSGLGSSVTMIDLSDHPADDLHSQVGDRILESHERYGVEAIYGASPSSISRTDDGVRLDLDGGRSIDADIALVAVGRKPALHGLGLESIGLDPDDLDVGDNGRIAGTDGEASVWVMGDAAGREQYTHVANRHAVVVANHLLGDASRSFGESVVPACIFIDPPVIVIGDTLDALADDDDVVWSQTEVEMARTATDELPSGFLALAGRRSTNTVVAAHGIGPRFDEIGHALVVAIDGDVPLDVLRRTIQPFPTVGEALGLAYDDLASALASD